MRFFDVVIVGAGPGGLIAGLLLARSGVHVAIFEAGPSFERAYRGETITPGTQQIFDDLGLLERVWALGGGDPAGISLTVRGRTYEIDLVDDPAKRIRQVPQPPLLTLLANEARAAGASLEMGTRVRGIVRDERSRISGITLSNDRNPETIGSRVVIAADGRFSVVRRDAGIALRTTSVPFDLLWMSGTGSGKRVHVIVDENEAFVAFPTTAHGAQIGWLIPKGTYGPIRAHGLDWIRSRVQRALAHAPTPMQATIERFDDLALLPTVSESAEQWTVPGMLLIGDAAHPMSPVGGQGINVAIADAVVTARRLATLVREGAEDARIDAALLAVERERAGPVERIGRQQNLIPGLIKRFGPERTLAMLGPLAKALVGKGKIPKPLRAAVDRFLLGDPPVRANHGPWLTAPPVAVRP